MTGIDCLRCSVADPHWFYPDTDPDPAFLVNANPDPEADPVQNPGF
jgi:hypothetical protein